MARVFLDANVYIDIIKGRKNIDLKELEGNDLFISPLSVHLLTYIFKYKIPDHELDVNREQFNLVPFSKNITLKALIGPTNDFEDNVQLHSAALSECDLFLTNDKELLAMKFFGKTQIIPPKNLNS